MVSCKYKGIMVVEWYAKLHEILSLRWYGVDEKRWMAICKSYYQEKTDW